MKRNIIKITVLGLVLLMCSVACNKVNTDSTSQAVTESVRGSASDISSLEPSVEPSLEPSVSSSIIEVSSESIIKTLTEVIYVFNNSLTDEESVVITVGGMASYFDEIVTNIEYGNIYQAPNALRFSSRKYSGYLTLTFNENIDIKKIIINVSARAAYATATKETPIASVNGINSEVLTEEAIDFEVELSPTSNIVDIYSLVQTEEGTNSYDRRFMLNSIKIFY